MVTVEDVRELALTLPATTERSSYGTPGFRVKDKLFARIHDNGDWLVLRMDQAQRELMAQEEPEKLFWTPHYENYSAVLARLDAIDRDELLELLTMAWLYVAPKRVAEQFVSANP